MPGDTAAPTAPMLTPSAVAERLGVSINKVHAWIVSGELRAVNVASAGSKRPRYRVAPDALDDLLRARAVGSAPPPSPRRRRKVQRPLRQLV